MAVMQRQHLGIREIGESVNIPPNPVARAMFYLRCICNVLDLNDGSSNLQRFTDFKNFYLLTDNEIDALTLLISSVRPQDLIGKCLFHNEEICGNSNNKFFELQEMRQNMVIVNDILIAGQQRRVNRIMFFKTAWLELYCIAPLRFLGDRMIRRKAELDARNARLMYYHQTGSGSSCCTIL
ncbi:uncharacterized protein LOC132551097 [Ylistrum balloti]|uniref:uncharacterized protein LOC132551097 n=1 Tax=Ylistrum balloti TaxID=509963 RepID=UPI002905D880|nr:uncharacterized protein LOC132551097 [Ylistrum balloti]